jgi:hypothetical protein
MLGEVAGVEETGEDSAARRGRRHEERERMGLGEAKVEHGVGAAESRVLGLRVGVGSERGFGWSVRATRSAKCRGGDDAGEMRLEKDVLCGSPSGFAVYWKEPSEI